MAGFTKVKITYKGYSIRGRTNGRYMVDCGSRGNRKRTLFGTVGEAKTAIDQLRTEVRNKGLEVLSLSDQDRLDVQAARGWLGSVRLSEVFDFWRKHHPAGEEKSVRDVIDEFLDAPGRRGSRVVVRRAATTECHRKRLLSFGTLFGARPVNAVSAANIEEWLDANGWTGLNRRHYLAGVRALLNYAVRKRYAATNPALAIELPDAIVSEPIIMTPEQVGTYLRTAEKVSPVLLVREAISFFCGLRPEELSRLEWRNLSIENKLITVTGEVAKVQGHRRNVAMSDNLLAWIGPYAKADGRIWAFGSTHLHKMRAKARTQSGVGVPGNAGRHAFASYHLAAFENAPATATALGHADVRLLRNVYANIVACDGRPITKAAAETYWKIMPVRPPDGVKAAGLAPDVALDGPQRPPHP